MVILTMLLLICIGILYRNEDTWLRLSKFLKRYIPAEADDNILKEIKETHDDIRTGAILMIILIIGAFIATLMRVK